MSIPSTQWPQLQRTGVNLMRNPNRCRGEFCLYETTGAVSGLEGAETEEKAPKGKQSKVAADQILNKSDLFQNLLYEK